MDIVSTGMHNAGNLGLKWEIIFFLHRECVDVRAERDAWTGFFAFYDSDRAGSGDPFHQRDAQGIQGAADVSGSVCLLKGELREGEALPSMRLLARELRISVITTKRAYDELEADGFLYTVAGKGCFVAEKNLDLIREQKLKELEDHLDAAVELAAQCGVSALELMEMLRILLKEEEPHV